MPGKLYVIATPLGHLGDLSPRAVETLKAVACVACEDTRRTATLLARFEIGTPTISCHRFNELQRLEPILSRLQGGEDVALVSDSGTPGVADPGSLLVRTALDLGVPVHPVPGPCAVATILSVSGLPADRFVFEGFLPHRAGARRRRLRELVAETRTIVLFETPHRIHEALADIAEVLGSRTLVLGRELTKMHETLRRGTAAQISEELPGDVRGEFTLAVSGARNESAKTDARAEEILDRWRESLAETGGDRRAALKGAARALGMKRPELFRRLAELGEGPDRDSSGG